jgi:hypothetical protein
MHGEYLSIGIAAFVWGAMTLASFMSEFLFEKLWWPVNIVSCWLLYEIYANAMAHGNIGGMLSFMIIAGGMWFFGTFIWIVMLAWVLAFGSICAMLLQ